MAAEILIAMRREGCNMSEWLLGSLDEYLANGKLTEQDMKVIKAAGGGNSFQDMKPLDKKLFEIKEVDKPSQKENVQLKMEI